MNYFKRIFISIFCPWIEWDPETVEFLRKELSEIRKNYHSSNEGWVAERKSLKEVCDIKQYQINQLKFKIVCIEEPEKPYRSKADVEIDDYLQKKAIDNLINEPKEKR